MYLMLLVAKMHKYSIKHLVLDQLICIHFKDFFSYQSLLYLAWPILEGLYRQIDSCVCNKR